MEWWDLGEYLRLEDGLRFRFVFSGDAERLRVLIGRAGDVLLKWLLISDVFRYRDFLWVYFSV